MKLNDILGNGIGLSEGMRIPELSEGNFQGDVGIIEAEGWGRLLGWRRVYLDPMRILLASADDSGIDLKTRQKLRKKYINLYKQLKNSELPRFYGENPLLNKGNLVRDRRIDKWGDGSEIVPHNFDPSSIEHGLIDHIITYATLTGKGEDRLFVNEVAKWLVYANLHLYGGFKPSFGTFYYRAFIRMTWLMIAFSETNLVENPIRNILRGFAKDNFIWLNNLTPDKEEAIDAIGWYSSKNVFYSSVDASKQNGSNRLIWVYFQVITNDLLLRIERTEFYRQNQREVDLFRSRIIATNRELFKRSNSFVGTFKAKYYDIDTEVIGKLPDAYPVSALGLSVNTEEHFSVMMKGVARQWSPFKAFDPYTLTMYDKVRRTGTIPEIPEVINPTPDLSFRKKTELLKDINKMNIRLNKMRKLINSN